MSTKNRKAFLSLLETEECIKTTEHLLKEKSKEIDGVFLAAINLTEDVDLSSLPDGESEKLLEKLEAIVIGSLSIGYLIHKSETIIN